MTHREEFEKALREMKIDAFHSLELNDNGDGYKNISTTILFAGFRIGLKAAKAQAVPEWIPVSERLPMDGEKVLIFDKYCTHGSIYTLMYYDGFMLKHKGVTHWMPLPAAPEQQK